MMTPEQQSLMAYKKDLFNQFGRLGRAVSHAGRLEILDLLCQAERTVEDLVHHSGRTPSNISQHLSVLKDARLVTGRKEGLFVYYKLADPVVAQFWGLFREVAMRCMADAREVVENYTRERDQPAPLHTPEFRRRLEKGDTVVLDVRPPVEFRAGHIPGALSIPFEELEDRIDEIPRDREVIAYCRGPYCLMAREAVEMLTRRGIRARALEEGVVEWRAEGRTVESDTPNGEVKS